MIEIRAWSPDNGLREGLPQPDLPALLSSPSEYVWVDMAGKNSGASEKILREVFHLHPMVVEDCLSTRRHPKVEGFDGYVYLITHGVVQRSTVREFATRELDSILGDRWLVTYHEPGSRSVLEAVEHLRRNPAALLGKGPDRLLHVILDAQVDQWTAVLDLFDERVAHLENRIFTEHGKKILDEIFDVRRSVMRLRRISTHQRETLLRLSRRDFPQIRAETTPYLRDVYDHLVRVSDLAELYRELVAGVLEAYLSVQSNRLNEVIRVLTVFATIFVPITFITSLYGMNFRFMPELEWRWGYLWVWGIMISVSGGLWLWMRRKGLL